MKNERPTMKTTFASRNIRRWLIGLLTGSLLNTKSKAATLALQPNWISDSLSQATRPLEGESTRLIHVFGSDPNTLADALGPASAMPEPAAYAFIACGIGILLFYRRSRHRIIKDLRKKKINYTLRQYIRNDSALPVSSQLPDTQPLRISPPPSLPKRRWDRITQNVSLVKNHPYEN
jgi:hypothetical protein